MLSSIKVLGCVGLLLASVEVYAQDKPSGFLCCNMRTDGKWISDINYDENGKRVIPAGTPLTVTGYGHYRVKVKIGGKDQAIGNDYSRDLTMEEFMRRYVVAEDPSREIASLPKNVQDALNLSQIRRGMTHQQVFMAVGYPVSSKNHDPNAKILRFWISSFSEFRVVFDDSGTVIDVEGDRDAKARVFPEA